MYEPLYLDVSSLPESIKERVEREHKSPIEGVVLGHHVDRGYGVTVYLESGKELTPSTDKAKQMWLKLFNQGST